MIFSLTCEQKRKEKEIITMFFDEGLKKSDIATHYGGDLEDIGKVILEVRQKAIKCMINVSTFFDGDKAESSADLLEITENQKEMKALGLNKDPAQYIISNIFDLARSKEPKVPEPAKLTDSGAREGSSNLKDPAKEDSSDLEDPMKLSGYTSNLEEIRLTTWQDAKKDPCKLTEREVMKLKDNIKKFELKLEVLFS
jgi:hypothetical protein